MNDYLALEAAILAPAASMLVTVAIRSANTRRRARLALRLADRRIAILSPRRAKALESALVHFLGTADGAVFAADPRTTERLNLFRTLRGERPARAVGPRHRKTTEELTRARPAVASQPITALARQYETA
ncbi:hypothetical protein [Pseudarthrobacter sp. BIM B-2242]|uniref:hypothetical protein n=1 Tax=Pseudarthrobacter sp. BIM B-2242 TaxID=2772401 RepID=UPI00168AFC38|nr:hypothetical protein [Pseudarthrobacter sp. BIM B-2242]QOD05813.1 hypothetical protein IDT60_22730 [Pseudarthrobacter sp. BIM B-2242]